MPEDHHHGAFAAIGRVIKEWGIKGSLKVLPLSPALSSCKPQDYVWLVKPTGEREKASLKNIKPLGKTYILSFQGIDDASAAKTYRSSMLELERALLPSLPEGEYYHEQIIGLSVFTGEGQLLGIIEEIFWTGSNDVYVVRNADREVLIPAVREIIRQIDLTNCKMIIQNMEGLID